nr:hypothetical protein [Tanacetum cinerariifolium]
MSTSSSKDAYRSQPKSSGKSAHAEEHGQKVNDLEDQSNHEFNTRNDDETSVREALDVYESTCKILVELEYHLEEVFKATNDRLDWHNPKGPQRQKFYGYAFNMETSKDVYSRHMIIAVTSLKIIKEQYALNVALRMFTRCIVIQERVEDLQLGVKSYQKKINLTRPDIYRSNLKRMTPYTAYSDIQGIIYKNEINRNRLTRIDKLHKFSDDTLNNVRTALNDIATGIEMDYLPKQK